MTDWLLDTNILSELRRPKPETKVLAFVSAQPLETLYVSAVTLAEIRFGIERLEDAGRRRALNDWLTHKVRADVRATCAPSLRGRHVQVALAARGRP